MARGFPGTKAPHGTLTRYTTHSCRCQDCRDAMAGWRRARYGYKARAEHLAEIEPEHGTESRYTSPRFKCRCEKCRAAANDARRKRNAADPEKARAAWREQGRRRRAAA